MDRVTDHRGQHGTVNGGRPPANHEEFAPGYLRREDRDFFLLACLSFVSSTFTLKGNV